MTPQQDVVKAKEKVEALRSTAMDALRYLISIQGTDNRQEISALLDYQQKSLKHFNYIEEFVGNSDLLGARESAKWAQGFAEDCYSVLEAMPGHWELLRSEFERLGLNPATCEPISTAFANMQRMVVAYLPREKRKALYQQLKGESLPVFGFEKKAKNYMSMNKVMSFVFGVSFIIVMLLIALLKPEPSEFQYKVFRAVLALACGGIGAVIPGILEVKVSKAIKAGGAIAIFVIVYFWNPAKMIG
jgi:hypothetical protein